MTHCYSTYRRLLCYSNYRRIVCTCGLFWIVTLSLLYFYFFKFSMSKLENDKGRFISNKIKESDAVRLMKRFEKELVIRNSIRGVLPEDERHVGEGMVLKIASPKLLRQYPRIAEYCNLPNKAIDGDEGNVSDQYELMSVHILTRHGDRSTIGRFQGEGEPHISCMLDEQLLKTHPKLAAFHSTIKSYSVKYKPHKRFRKWAMFPNHTICRPGDLTGMGVLQHLVLGDYLAIRYRNLLSTFDGESLKRKVYIKSTETIRTYQSAIAFLYGFFPSFNTSHFPIGSAVRSMCDDKNLGTSCRCNAVFKFHIAHEQFVANHNRMNDKPVDIIKNIADIYALSYDEVMRRAWSFLDLFMVHSCHNLPIKCDRAGRCIDGEIIQRLWDFLDNRQWLFENPGKYIEKEAVLNFYPLLSEIAGRMKNIAKGANKPRFSLYSGHDVVLAGVLIAFNAYSDNWSPYASRLIFEHYRHKAHDSHHVRVVFNGRDITTRMPFCENLASLSSLCNLRRFTDYTESRMLGDLFGSQSYNEVCEKQYDV